MIDAVVLFFVLGLVARLGKSDLRLPEALYETLSIFLLLAIGLKGGVELARQPLASVLPAAAAALTLGAAIPLLLYPVLRAAGRLGVADAASIAAHYGSVSVVTFAVAMALLTQRGIGAERGEGRPPLRWGPLLHEVVFGKSVLLLLGGLAIGAIAGPTALAPVEPLFVNLFKGVLALFLLEMGLVVGGRLGDIRRAGPFLVAFGLLVPLLLGALGATVGHLVGLSLGGTALLATLAASASYIAAPTAMRIAVPEANPALSIGVVLGVTFPFNITVGIPLYLGMARWLGS